MNSTCAALPLLELSVDENWPCAFAPSPVTYLCLEPVVFYQLKPLVGQRVSRLWNGQHLYPIPKLAHESEDFDVHTAEGSNSEFFFSLLNAEAGSEGSNRSWLGESLKPV